MWFKNLRPYRLTSPFELTAEQLEEKLQQQLFQPCGKTQASRVGWVPALSGGELLVHAAGNCLLVCMRREERILPATVVREELDNRVADIELEQGRKVRRKEKESMKDEIIMDYLPRAFTRSNHTYAYIDVTTSWLFVDSASAGKAEELVNLLRESIGTLPLLLPEVNNAPTAVMSSWLQNSTVPEGLVIGTECELRDPSEEGGVVRCRRQDLYSEEIQTHLEAGKRVDKLAVEWQEQLNLVLSEDLCLRRLKFSEAMSTANDDIDSEDYAARFDADFALMTSTLTPLITEVMAFFGGEARE